MHTRTRPIGIYAQSLFLWIDCQIRCSLHTWVFLTVTISCLFSSFSFFNLFHSITLELHKLTIYLEIFKRSVKLQALCRNIVWGQWVFWVPQCAARHLHNLCNSYKEFESALNSDICTMLIDVAVLACGLLCAGVHNESVLSSPGVQYTRRVCVGESEWPRVLFFGLWLFGGQSWCSLCLREWIYHLQPYRELHPLSWLVRSQREKFRSPFLPFSVCSPETFTNSGDIRKIKKRYSSYIWTHFHCERAENKTLHFSLDLPYSEVGVFNPRIDCSYYFDLCYFMDSWFSLSSSGSGMVNHMMDWAFSLMNSFLLLSHGDLLLDALSLYLYRLVALVNHSVSSMSHYAQITFISFNSRD